MLFDQKAQLAMLDFLAPAPGGGWRPGIGDPSFTGWLTVVAYFVAAWLCGRAARASHGTRRSRRESYIWIGLTCLLVLLGINKQLDLQTGLTELGRVLAKQQGWYPRRRYVQRWFIVGTGLTAASSAAALLWIARRHLRQLGVALVGACLVLAFVVIRAASFHRFDDFIATRLVPGIAINVPLELSGITLLGFGAWRASRRATRAARATDARGGGSG